MKKKQEMLLSNFQSQQETVTQEKQVNVIEEMPKKKNERTVDDVVDEKGGKMEHGRPGRKTGKKVRASLKPLDFWRKNLKIEMHLLDCNGKREL